MRTRHQDAMLLSEFLVTRVVGIAVHGIDLACADQPAEAAQVERLGLHWLTLG